MHSSENECLTFSWVIDVMTVSSRLATFGSGANERTNNKWTKEQTNEPKTKQNKNERKKKKKKENQDGGDNNNRSRPKVWGNKR